MPGTSKRGYNTHFAELVNESLEQICNNRVLNLLLHNKIKRITLSRILVA